jgi:hypothetical protein
LDTSIRRHDGTHHRAHEAAHGIDLSAPIRRSEHAPAAPASHSSLRSPNYTKSTRSHHGGEPRLQSASLNELNQLLQSKRGDFARLRDENRRRLAWSLSVASHRPAFRRQTPDDSAQSHSNNAARKHREPRPRDVRSKCEESNGGPASPLSSSSSATSSPADLSSRTSYSSGRARKLQSSKPQETERTLTATADKACHITPSDFGPDVNDLPRQRFTQSHGATQTAPIDHQHCVPDPLSVILTRGFCGSPGPASAWSSSCSSASPVSSSNVSCSSKSRSDSSSSRRSLGGPRRSRRNDPHPPPTHHPLPTTNAARSIPPSDEQLEWELDLSNFNI